MIIDILGQSINYEVHGKGKDILLLHGWGTNISTYKTIINSFSDRFKITTLDFPGFGKSSPLKRAWTICDYTELIQQFMLKLNIVNPIIVGHSHGGRVAIHLVATKGIELHKMILIDSAGIKPKRKLKYYSKVYLFKTIKFFLTLPILKNKTTSLINKARNYFGSKDYNSVAGELRKTLVSVINEDLTNLLRKIPVPTLLIWGEKDTATPLYQAKMMEKMIPDAGLVVLKDAGHFSYLDRPYEFNAIVSNFLREDII